MASNVVPAFDPGSAQTASAYLREEFLSEEALAVVRGEANLRQSIDALLAAGLPADALQLIARALPAKYAIGWACACFRKYLHAKLPTWELDRAALSLTERWLMAPSEENRRAALDFAEQGALKSPGCWLAAAAGWSEGSLAPKGYDPVPPPPTLSAEAVVAALRLLAYSDAEQAPKLLTQFVQDAITTFGGDGSRGM